MAGWAKAKSNVEKITILTVRMILLLPFMIHLPFFCYERLLGRGRGGLPASGKPFTDYLDKHLFLLGAQNTDKLLHESEYFQAVLIDIISGPETLQEFLLGLILYEFGQEEPALGKSVLAEFDKLVAELLEDLVLVLVEV